MDSGERAWRSRLFELLWELRPKPSAHIGVRSGLHKARSQHWPWDGHLDAIALRELFLKFEYQRRVAAGHLFGDEAAEVLWLGPLIQQSISHKLGQRAELLVSQSDWRDQQGVEALEDWIKWAAEDYQIGSDAGIE